MFDIEVGAPDGASSLHRIGRVLGAAGVGLEGGGMWSGTAHYLINDPETAVQALSDAALGPVTVRDVLIAELDADVPGALGIMMGKLVTAGVLLHAQYSDHDNRKVLVVENLEAAQEALKGRAI